MKGEASVEGGGNWDEREEGVAIGLLKAGGEEIGGRVIETEGEPMELGLVPGRDRGLDRPERQRTRIVPQSNFSLSFVKNSIYCSVFHV